MNHKQTEAIRLHRLKEFRELILPILSKRYPVIDYNTMFKIKRNGIVMDYYPMAQRIFKCGNKTWVGEWKDCTLDRFIEKFIR